jgi:hypothetical protein
MQQDITSAPVTFRIKPENQPDSRGTSPAIHVLLDHFTLKQDVDGRNKSQQIQAWRAGKNPDPTYFSFSQPSSCNCKLYIMQ